MSIDECGGKLDVYSTYKASNIWREFDGTDPKRTFIMAAMLTVPQVIEAWLACGAAIFPV
jgi:hypothetical protein